MLCAAEVPQLAPWLQGVCAARCLGKRVGSHRPQDIQDIRIGVPMRFLNRHVCPCVDDRDMAGRYVHMFSSKAGFEGAIAGMGAYVHEDDTYNVALQAGLIAFPFDTPAAMKRPLCWGRVPVYGD
jgi:hypothetical protein